MLEKAGWAEELLGAFMRVLFSRAIPTTRTANTFTSFLLHSARKMAIYEFFKFNGEHGNVRVKEKKNTVVFPESSQKIVLCSSVAAVAVRALSEKRRERRKKFS